MSSLNVVLPAGAIHQLSSILLRWFSILLSSVWAHSKTLGFASKLRIYSSASFTLFPGYPGLCSLDRHTKHLHTLHAFAEWVTQSMTDCVWSAKWAEDSTTGSRSVRQQHVALAGELSFLHSKWYHWSNVFVSLRVWDHCSSYFSVCSEHQVESEDASGCLLC